MKFLFFLLLLSTASVAQMKIGSLTVKDSLGLAYLMDCYKHPDTIPHKELVSSWQMLGGGSYMEYYYPDKDVRVAYNETISKAAIRQLTDSIYHPSFQDTSFNYEPSFWISDNNRMQKERIKQRLSGVKSIRTIPAFTEWRPNRLFLVPRQPSESDFIKWIAKGTK